MTFQDGDSCVFKFGDTLVNLLKVAAAPELIQPARVANGESGSRFVLTLEVDDVDALCAQLITRGMDRPWGPRTASFMDPGGHIWEIAK